jgi:beta-1,4-mannosyl-glycoprotein beta-1,4-N-acetylglucosaminyltransferase
VRQLWDCFYVNDELDLVELRMQMLESVVDRFVVVEAGLTFSGAPKPLNFKANQARFARWSDRIQHVEAELPTESDDAWTREYAQRAQLREALQRSADPSTVLVVGDVDEMPDPAVLRRLKHEGVSSSIRLGMRHANYYANWVMKTEWDLGPMVFTPQLMDEPSVAHLLGDRSFNDRSREAPRLSNAGWHLSFLGGPDVMRRKIRAYSHQDFAIDANLRLGHLERCMRWGSTFTGYHVLKKQRLDELDDVQRFVLARRPEWFSFGQRSTFIRAHAYNGYCRALLTDSLGPVIGPLTTRWPSLVTSLLLPWFLARDTLRRVKDRRRPPP